MLESNLVQRGREIALLGLRSSDIVVDLDETLWEWTAPILRQPSFFSSHSEFVFVRYPLLWLLSGITASCSEPISAWTAGYGYRLDRIAEQIPELSAILGLSGQPSEQLPHVFTRRNFAHALSQAPELIPAKCARLLSQKLPGVPTAGGKPSVDQARILLDDKESNCQRYVDSGNGRSAIWLRGAPRQQARVLPLTKIVRPRPHRWADGVADALTAIAKGSIGLYPVDPVASEHSISAVKVSLPHRVLWQNWVVPSRTINRLKSQKEQTE